MIRLVQIALLLAIVIPLGMVLRWGDAQLPQRVQDVLTGIPIGIAICYAFWMWDNRIRQREAGGKRAD